MITHPTPAAQVLSDEQIDLIANDGMRNAAGGIYATRVYEFARAVLAAAQAPQAEPVDEAAPGSLDAFFAAFREVFPADATAIAPAHVATELDGVPTAWVSNCPYCRRDLHIVAATDQGAAAEAASRLTQAPQAVAQPEPIEGNLPRRVWLNDMGLTQKLSFEPLAGASEHFEYVPATPPTAQPATQAVEVMRLARELVDAELELARQKTFGEPIPNSFFVSRSDAECALESAAQALASPPAAALDDTRRLEWLLPNLHPANFDMEFPGGYEWDSDAEFLAKWRAAIDAELAAAQSKEMR